ncbi:MAG TPA: hypothetical protein VGE16_13000 [Albitalea sp.]
MSREHAAAANAGWLNRRMLWVALLVLPFGAAVGAQPAGRARADTESLLRAAVPAAQGMLRLHGEFMPFAVGMANTGEAVEVGEDSEADPASALQRTGRLREALAHGLKSGRYRATAYVYEARIANPPSERQNEAIAVALEHRDGYSAVVVIPYEFVNGDVRLGAAQRIERHRGKPAAAQRK